MVPLAILLFLLFSASPVFANEPILTIQSIPASAILGESFSLNFDFQNALPETAYYFKAYEGSSSDKAVQIYVNDNWQNSYLTVDWLLMPQFTTDQSGNINQVLQIRANHDSKYVSGDYQLYLKSVLVSTKKNPCSSQSHIIQIKDPPFSPTPSLTLSPTNSPVPENTPINTPIPTDTSDSQTSTPQPTPNLVINSWPSSADLGQEFVISFTLDNIQPDTDYYVKAYEDSDTNKSLDVLVNGSWQSTYKGASWSSMPQFSSNNSTISDDLQLRAKSDKDSGDYQIYLKATLDSDSEIYLSSSKTVSINSIDSPNTPTPTLTPTLVVSPTTIPTPSVSPTFSPTPAGIDTISSASESSILGAQDIQNTPTPKSKKSQSTSTTLIPKICLTLGSLMLLVPALIAKIKKC